MRFNLENGRAVHVGTAQLRHRWIVHERLRGCLCEGTLVTVAVN